MRITARGAFYDSELTSDFADFNEDGSIEEIKAPKGTPLSDTPKFKGYVVARYNFPVGGYEAYVQGALTYIGERRSDLEPEDYAIRGDFPALTLIDLAVGLRTGSWSFDLFVKNATNNDTAWYDTAQCSFSTCGDQRYIIRERPITISLKVTRDFSVLLSHFDEYGVRIKAESVCVALLVIGGPLCFPVQKVQENWLGRINPLCWSIDTWLR